MRPIKETIIHCSATRPEWMAGATVDAKVSEIRRWHKSKTPPWSDIGYHFVIDRNGFVAKGRPITRTGAHVKGRNSGTIGVCLIGGHGSAETDEFSEHFTPMQDKALRALIADLQSKYGPLHVSGHNQYAAKACPGFGVPEWIVQQPVAAPEPTPQTFASIIRKFFALLFKRKG